MSTPRGTALRAVGTMVGTSLDAVDVAVVECPGPRRWEELVCLTHGERALEPRLADRLREIAEGAPTDAAELSACSFELAHLHAEAVESVWRRVASDTERPHFVAAHGVTVCHAPASEGGHGWQLLSGAALAARLRCPVVCDFRGADLARGGQGAPLAPLCDLALRTHPSEDRVVLNLGGIANFTALPAGARRTSEILCGDVGPANMALDALHRAHTRGQERYDRDGRVAASGTPDDRLVTGLLAEEWVRRPLPRSFGREQFGSAWSDAVVRASPGLGHADRLASLIEAQARALALLLADLERRHWRRSREPLRVLVTGGGRRNRATMAALRRCLGAARVEGIEAIGVDPAAKEAIDFALLGAWTTEARRVDTRPITGADEEVILGCVHRPRAMD